MRAREPDAVGVVERGGVRVPYEVFGDGEPTIALLPSWPIVHARQWKMQVPTLARHHRVVVVEGRGNGGADRPLDPASYRDAEQVLDVLDALDALGVDRAVLVGTSAGGRRAVQTAAWHPERVLGVVAIAPALPVDHRSIGHGLWDPAWWYRDYAGFTEAFMAAMLPEEHSLKAREDCVARARETGPEVLAATGPAMAEVDAAAAEATVRAVRCPVLVVQGDRDLIVRPETGATLATWSGGALVELAGSGHVPGVRDPVRVNGLIRGFAARFAPPAPRRWSRPLHRRRRALLVCSPIGLGHVRRDLAIAGALRERHPDLQIDWLTQDPVTRVLAARGERVHPASRWLASESAHVEQQAGEHDLHAFRAVRDMDEILAANFGVFQDVVTDDPYDLWIADEGWDVDHFLFDNPELKSAPYAWLTDFVGWLPMPEGGAAEEVLTADWNTEHVTRMRRWPRLRDRSVFVGDPDDLVDVALGPDLPTVREWGCERHVFAGYVTGPEPPVDREQARADLGFRDGERVCVVAVGGSAVGRPLLARVAAAFPAAARSVPGLRMVLVTGPRIDPASVPVPRGVEVLGYVPDLPRMLAACDVAVVQGGLTTTMELVAARVPFVYVPLRRHFEQQVHVPARLARHGAGRRLDWADADPDRIAALIAEEVARPVGYRPVDTGGAARAADLLADLL
ncbi:alpha/beta hydrolase [Pseudonocardia hydrocarbonoxydans]|uniref:Alpha/beta hydrolase n=1 Tax=Pseudonocardia hydrocarbonoxydans TaxID=76726 RepID=A0A4Y3WN20_9PSEU|nr:alpha/beta hydrolase [Pseudonocardia hydrocarbonoxydans]GEC19440.1 hypothetical protein PHY01_17230 [Pseudonocardia hydrocarbonoxydans]